jgi:transcription elongation factor/antiterminator RfaH
MDDMSSSEAAAIDVTLGARRSLRDRLPTYQELAAKAGDGLDPASAGRAPSNPAAGMRWYVVYTQPHRELRAHTQLAVQGFRSFLPRYRKTIRHARRLMTVNAPFFSRYLFVALDLGQDQWRSVNGTFGVVSLISDGTFPVPIASGVVESLINVADANGFMNLGDTLQVGERVRVLTGPFADLVGELVRLDGAQRVQVLLQLLNGIVAVSINRGDLAPVCAA